MDWINALATRRAIADAQKILKDARDDAAVIKESARQAAQRLADTVKADTVEQAKDIIAHPKEYFQVMLNDAHLVLDQAKGK